MPVTRVLPLSMLEPADVTDAVLVVGIGCR